MNYRIYSHIGRGVLSRPELLDFVTHPHISPFLLLKLHCQIVRVNRLCQYAVSVTYFILTVFCGSFMLQHNDMTFKSQMYLQKLVLLDWHLLNNFQYTIRETFCTIDLQQTLTSANNMVRIFLTDKVVHIRKLSILTQTKTNLHSTYGTVT